MLSQSGTGTESLISAVFGAPFAVHPLFGYGPTTDHLYDVQGPTGINQEITSQRNKRLAIHYFNDYEPGSVEKIGILKKFMADRSQKKSFAERLHAIWYGLRSHETTLIHVISQVVHYHTFRWIEIHIGRENFQVESK
jgi:hypothetical protein